MQKITIMWTMHKNSTFQLQSSCLVQQDTGIPKRGDTKNAVTTPRKQNLFDAGNIGKCITHKKPTLMY